MPLSTSGRIKDKRQYIWQLLDIRVGGLGPVGDAGGGHEEGHYGGYLVLMRCDDSTRCAN